MAVTVFEISMTDLKAYEIWYIQFLSINTPFIAGNKYKSRAFFLKIGLCCFNADDRAEPRFKVWGSKWLYYFWKKKLVQTRGAAWISLVSIRICVLVPCGM